MRTASELQEQLKRIDHRSYPAYKELRGQYDFGDYILSIDHVQGDPFAAPSRLSVLVSGSRAGFPGELFDTAPKRITLQDQLTRAFGRAVQKGSFQAKGSGKSGLLSVSRCGQQVLERTALRIAEGGAITLRFEAGFPASGRTIQAGELSKMLFTILPEGVRSSLFYEKADREGLRRAARLCENQQFIRKSLKELSLCAFVADGSILPRESGVSERPMKGAVPFQSPETLRVTLRLPDGSTVRGMGIPRGITLFVGGGYHGKSTILQALQNGVYNHIEGDGREYVITDDTAFKLRAEDGRCISGVDISPFIRNLPSGKDTACFSTEDASGSTSQAANLMEAVESGSRLLLIDEDTSATNFMIRDQLMSQVITPAEEPITPFIGRVRGLYADQGISTIIVAGSSGSYFHVADQVIQMKEYVPYDITRRAKQAAEGFPVMTGGEEPFPSFQRNRRPKPDPVIQREERIKLKAMGTWELMLSRESVELRYLEQLKDQEQTLALAYILRYVEKRLFDGNRSLEQIGELLEKQLQEQGMEGLFEKGENIAFLACPRRQEILACINRYPRLFFDSRKPPVVH